MAEDQPGIELDWNLWCGKHLEPYRARWPLGAGVAMMRLLNAAKAMPAITDYCTAPGAAKADTAKLTEALRRFRPLCCFVGQEAMERIYAETVPGRADG